MTPPPSRPAERVATTTRAETVERTPDLDEDTPAAAPVHDAPGLPGVGPKLLARAVRAFGSEEGFLDACRAGEVDRIAAVPGIGPARAVELVHAARGTGTPDLFGTPRVAEIFERIRDDLVGRAATRHGKNELRLLAPLADPARRQERLAWALGASAEIEGLDVQQAVRHLKNIRPLAELTPAYEGGIMVFVDAPEDEDTLLEAGIDRWASVYPAQDAETAAACEAGIYAYSDGNAAIFEADHILSVPFTTDLAVLVPWAVTGRFQRSRDTLEAAAALALLRGRRSPCAEALALLAELPATNRSLDASTLEAEATEALAAALREADDALTGITLTAADLVRAMQAEAPQAVRQVYKEAVQKARRALAVAVGLEADVFTETVPPKVDPEAVHAAIEEQRRLGAHARLERMQKVAKGLERLRPQVEAEIADHQRFDARQAVGAWVREHTLTAPEWGHGIVLEGALHLDHSPHGDRVAYRIGADSAGGPETERLALLTGANSGGKTTLLETVAQVVLLAHAGLPVPAARAVVPELDAVHFHAERRSLGAGAFEAFLRRFFPLADTEGRILVLADELEAMTELEAAAEIVAAFLERLATRDAYAILATHMAPHIVPAVLGPAQAVLRVDGIEARGLDEEGRLIVDRSPRLGVRARSTPELILRRLARHGPEGQREQFAALAERVAVAHARADEAGAARPKR